MRLSLPRITVDTSSKKVTNLEIADVLDYVDPNTKVVLEKEASEIHSEKQKLKAKRTVPTIRSVYKNEIDEFGRYLYIKMKDLETRPQALRVWDNLGYLSDKPIDDMNALQKIEDVLIRMGYLTEEQIEKKNILEKRL